MQKREAHRFDKLYTKFIQALELQGYAQVTVDSYGRGIRRVAEYFECCPDQRLSPDDLRGYFAELLKTHSWSTIKLDRNALQHYWRMILNRDWDWVEIVKPPKRKSLPDILSPDEINRVLEVTQSHALSCGHRSCPRCQNAAASQWLYRQQQKLIPAEYFMVTLTIPDDTQLIRFFW